LAVELDSETSATLLASSVYKDQGAESRLTMSHCESLKSAVSQSTRAAVRQGLPSPACSLVSEAKFGRKGMERRGKEEDGDASDKRPSGCDVTVAATLRLN
jgi:hypothetical protein